MPENESYFSAGANLMGQAIGALAQGNINKASRRWNEKMWQWQRDAALADWTMQNEYNHPSAVMARMREAGLNPAMMYGKGPGELASGPIRSSDHKAWNPKPPEFNPGSAMAQLYDTEVKNAQIDNLRAQNTVMVEDAALKKASTIESTMRTAQTAANTARSKFDLDLASELRQTSVDAAKAQLRQTQANTQFTLNSDERAALSNTQSLQEGATRILKMRQEMAHSRSQINEIQHRIHNIEKDTQIKELDRKLKADGLQPSDPAWQRVISRLLSGDLDVNKALPPIQRYGKNALNWWMK